MNRFSYTRSASVEEGVEALGAVPSARVIAGGTNIVDLIKYNVEKPEHLVDITRISDLSGISVSPEGGLSLGALATNAETAVHPLVSRDYPLLASAILSAATPQLRNAATTGGNLNQRTRCYYFYDTAAPCNKREPGTGCPAITGLNRIHAILGTSVQCIATHPSDMCVALAALGAVVHVTGPAGERAIPMAEYHRLPGDTPHIDTTRAQDEIVTRVELPSSASCFASNFTYLKLRDRASYAFALVSVAAALEMAGDTVSQARIALGGVAHKPWRKEEAEAVLIGRPATSANFAKAAEVLLVGAQGFGHNSFKINLARKAVVRALEQAAAGTPQSITDKRIA
jgi:xanthine dehydrogenase YagS FAD-binding subunit